MFFTEIRLAEMSSMGIGSKPCLDIRPSNNQINDRSITISQLGKGWFFFVPCIIKFRVVCYISYIFPFKPSQPKN